MSASLLILVGIGFSLGIGALAVVFAYFGAQKSSASARWPIYLAGTAVALLLNSWWLVMLGLLFVKFVVLQEDT